MPVLLIKIQKPCINVATYAVLILSIFHIALASENILTREKVNAFPGGTENQIRAYRCVYQSKKGIVAFINRRSKP